MRSEVRAKVRTNFDQKVGNFFGFFAPIALIRSEQRSNSVGRNFKLRRIRTFAALTSVSITLLAKVSPGPFPALIQLSRSRAVNPNL